MGGQTIDRGVAEGVGYMFAFGLMGIFVIMLLTQASAVFGSAVDSAQNEQLEFYGERTASVIESVDREVRSDSTSGEVREVVNVPEQVAGDHYYIDFTYSGADEQGEIILSPVDRDANVTVKYYSKTPITEAERRGGTLEIVRPSSGTSIEVNDAE